MGPGTSITRAVETNEKGGQQEEGWVTTGHFDHKGVTVCAFKTQDLNCDPGAEELRGKTCLEFNASLEHITRPCLKNQ